MMDWPIDWGQFEGSGAAIRLAKRDLPNLQKVTDKCRHHRVAVQAGGNLGIFPKWLASMFETVYTFEPSAFLFPLLLRNAPEVNIIRFQAALGETRGHFVNTVMARRGWKIGRPVHEGVTHIDGPGPIPTLRLDDFALPVCDLLALDVEGYEVYALRGAQETIRRCRPVLCIEVNENLKYEGFTRNDVLDVIGPLYYRSLGKLTADEVFVPC